MNPSTIHLIHDRGVSTESHVLLLQVTLGWYWNGQEMTRELYPHSEVSVPAEESAAWAMTQNFEEGALVVGQGIGGLIAAAVQENSRPDLTVICINSPTVAEGVALRTCPDSRWSFYSSGNPRMLEHASSWPFFANCFDLPYITNDANKHVRVLAAAVRAVANGKPVEPVFNEALQAWQTGQYEKWRLS